MSKISDKIFNNEKNYVTSAFGWRIHPITKIEQFHNGTDYGTNRVNLTQYSIDEGIVTAADFNSAKGNYIEIKYDRFPNLIFIHYHLAKLYVKKGQTIDEGTILGSTGMTGSATGIHLHLGIYDTTNKKYIDPELFSKDYVDYVAPVVQSATYKVIKGDTLSKIASKFNTSVDVLLTLNKKKYPKMTKNYIVTGWLLNVIKSDEKIEIKEIVKGSKVKIKSNAIFYAKPEAKIANFAKNRVSIVAADPKNDMALVKYNNVVLGYVYLKDLEVV